MIHKEKVLNSSYMLVVSKAHPAETVSLGLDRQRSQRHTGRQDFFISPH